jgi:hypothetical protein
MEDSESEKLCAHLSGTVGKMPADTFYQEFNLMGSTIFSEFYFKEMIEIYHLPGMELWPKIMSVEGTKEKDRPPQICLSLVCFMPPAATSSQPPSIRKRVSTAHAKAHHMLCSSFESEEDHKCIDVAMANFPTIAIFLSQVDHQDKKKKSHNKKHRRSIFDMKDTSQLQCLAAVNYFRDGTQTQVLWLATTLEAPPIESIHVMW